MLADADRLQHTVEQVLKAGVAGSSAGAWCTRAPVDLARARARSASRPRGCATTCRPSAIALVDARRRADALIVDGDVDELRTALLEPARQRREVLAATACR